VAKSFPDVDVAEVFPEDIVVGAIPVDVKRDEGAFGSLNVKEAGTLDLLTLTRAPSTILNFCDGFSTVMFFQSTFTGSVEFDLSSLDLDRSIPWAFRTLGGRSSFT